MKRQWRGILPAVGTGTFLILATAVSAPVQGSDPPHVPGPPAQWGREVWAPHFGQVDTTRGHLLETVVSSRQIRVYIYDRNGDPEDVGSAKGQSG